MKAYTVFAKVYDEFMSDIPYKLWADNITAYLQTAGFEGCRILELGCGTGNFTKYLADMKYEVKGIDISQEMLRQAKRKLPDCIFEQQDMRAFEDSVQYPVIVSVCDAVNYLTCYFDLKAMFECAARTLCENGIFIFDMKTEGYFQRLGNGIYTDEIPKGSYIWENDYDAQLRDNSYFITFYLKAFAGLYRKYTEEHTQHSFTHDEVCSAAREAGLSVRAVMGPDLKPPADWQADRIYYILERKKHE